MTEVAPAVVTLREALAAGAARLVAGSESPRLDAELLLAGVLGTTRSQLLARGAQRLDEASRDRYGALLARREQGEPVAYLLGSWGFWTLDLQVGADVLVPRPETELLVEWALERLPREASPRVADLGTGSGAIALAIARERPAAQVVATDVSAAALAVARANAQSLGLARVGFVHGDWYAALADRPNAPRFDLIVSNPPYIAAGDPHLPALRHEPQAALTDGADGLSCLRAIVAGAPAHLQPGGWLLVEHGFDQGAAVRALFAQAGFADVETRRDLGRQERATGGRIA